MYTSAIMAFLHHLAAFTVVGALVVEVVLFKPPLTVVQARRLQRTDSIFGAAATVLLIVGLLRVFYFEKGATYYFGSHAFLTKLGLFILLALLSAIPTVEFLSWRPALQAGQVPQPNAKKLRIITGVIQRAKPVSASSRSRTSSSRTTSMKAFWPWSTAERTAGSQTWAQSEPSSPSANRIPASS